MMAPSRLPGRRAGQGAPMVRLAPGTGGGYLARAFGVVPTDMDALGRPVMDVEVSA